MKKHTITRRDPRLINCFNSGEMERWLKSDNSFFYLEPGISREQGRGQHWRCDHVKRGVCREEMCWDSERKQRDDSFDCGFSQESWSAGQGSGMRCMGRMVLGGTWDWEDPIVGAMRERHHWEEVWWEQACYWEIVIGRSQLNMCTIVRKRKSPEGYSGDYEKRITYLFFRIQII